MEAHRLKTVVAIGKTKAPFPTMIMTYSENAIKTGRWRPIIDPEYKELDYDLINKQKAEDNGF